MDMKVGDTVWLKLPYGEFVVESRETAPAVLVAGGTGVVPFVSLVTSALTLAGPVQLLYGARRAELLVYSDAMNEASLRHPQFSWRAFVEDGEADGATRGCLSVEAVLEAVEATDEPAAAVIYLSGPPAMVDSLTAGLGEAGISPERIRVDAWA